MPRQASHLAPGFVPIAVDLYAKTSLLHHIRFLGINLLSEFVPLTQANHNAIVRVLNSEASRTRRHISAKPSNLSDEPGGTIRGSLVNITELTTEQRQAVMDLLILGMYADRNLASAEDACVQKLLGSFQFPSDFERDKFSDAAFTRTSRHTGSPEAIKAYVNELAKQFPKAEMRQMVYNRLNELLTSDGRVTAEESQLLCAVKAAFQL